MPSRACQLQRVLNGGPSERAGSHVRPHQLPSVCPGTPAEALHSLAADESDSPGATDEALQPRKSIPTAARMDTQLDLAIAPEWMPASVLTPFAVNAPTHSPSSLRVPFNAQCSAASTTPHNSSCRSSRACQLQHVLNGGPSSRAGSHVPPHQLPSACPGTPTEALYPLAADESDSPGATD